MRLSKKFWFTQKEVPHDAQIPSHKLCIRAGLISKSAAGLYNYLPMMQRSLQKIENIIRQEHEKIDSNEVSLSFMTPASVWKESGRWNVMGPEMLKFKDRKSNDFCLSPTNEEAMVDIFRKSITSYKQLPISLYQIKSKVRDEIRPRFGLMRGREFTMKDAYSFSLDHENLDEEYSRFYKAYESIFRRIGLQVNIVEADGGAMASTGAKTHEFQALAESGEDLIVYAPNGYAANQEKAKTIRKGVDFSLAKQIEEIETIDLQTCDEVCKSLNRPITHSLKSIVVTARYESETKNVMVLLLGDDELNEVKLKNHLACLDFHPAKQTTLDELGLPKGYMGPLEKDEVIHILIDQQVSLSDGYIVGANKENYHVDGYCPQRDSKNFEHVDLRLAKEGDWTCDGESQIQFKKGIEVGHIFQLGDKYTSSMGVKVLDKNGKAVAPLMGCYGIGVTRTLAAAIEQSHDENGIIWPKQIAPYQIYFSKIGKKEETIKICDEIYESLKEAGFETLYDDRGLGPGPMFKDADLLGLPIRVVLGERDFLKDGMLEIKLRKTSEVFKVSKQDLVSKLKELWESI